MVEDRDSTCLGQCPGLLPLGGGIAEQASKQERGARGRGRGERGELGRVVQGCATQTALFWHGLRGNNHEPCIQFLNCKSQFSQGGCLLDFGYWALQLILQIVHDASYIIVTLGAYDIPLAAD